MSLETLWASMEADTSQSGSGMLYRSVQGGAYSAVQAGLRLPMRERVLLLRLPVAGGRALVRDGLTPAITLELGEATGYSGQVLVCLAAPEPHHRALFAHIGEDLVAQLQGDPTNPAGVILERLALWRAFLARQDEAGGETWVRGLFGELWFLHRHVLPALPGIQGVAAWVGPEGAAQDFRTGRAALDMKTGTPDSETVQISSLEQLTPLPGTELFLGHLRLRRDRQGMHLRELVGCIRDGLPEDARALFRDRLLAQGYLETAGDALEILRFTPLPLVVYRIGPDFPALSRTQVPPAVTACSYSLDLAACRRFRVDPADIPGLDRIRGGSHGD